MSRRSRFDVGLYAPRVSRIPTFIPRRGPKTPSSGGGNAFKNWVELPIDPTNDYWTVLKNGNANSSDVTVDLNSDHLRVEFGGSTNKNYQIQGSTFNGVALVKSTHLNWWQEAGISVPSGEDAHNWCPEAVQFKFEVQFDTTNGPISAQSSGGNGTYLSVCAGLATYAADQEGSPHVGGTNMTWGGAYVFKNLAAQPAGSTNANMYKSGHRDYFTNGLNTGGLKWRGQNGSGTQDLDSIVWASVPLRNTAESASGRYSFVGGAYSQGNPFGQMYGSNFAYQTAYGVMQGRYCHPALFIGGATSNVTRGEVRIKKIRMFIQPLQHRVAL